MLESKEYTSELYYARKTCCIYDDIENDAGFSIDKNSNTVTYDIKS